MISICVIKICGNLIYRSLGLIFQSCLTLKPTISVNTYSWYRVVYQSLSFRFIKKLWKGFFITEWFFCFSKKQSKFKTRDSCIYQFLSIPYDIYQSFNYGLEKWVSHWKYVENAFNSFMTEAVITVMKELKICWIAEVWFFDILFAITFTKFVCVLTKLR